MNRVDDRHINAPMCCEQTKLVIKPVQIQAQILGGGNLPGYLCPVTGDYVTSRTKRREIMKEHNLIETGDSNRHSKNREQMLTNTNETGVSQ